MSEETNTPANQDFSLDDYLNYLDTHEHTSDAIRTLGELQAWNVPA